MSLFRRKKFNAFDAQIARQGRLFVLPWLIGFLLFFLKPIIELFYYAFHRVEMKVNGGLEFTPLGFKNFHAALFEDTKFNRYLSEAFMAALPKLLLVLIFALIVAILLNGKYPGRAIARAVFFIPIIMASKSISTVVGGMQSQMIQDASAGSEGQLTFLISFLSRFLDAGTLNYLLKSVSSIFETILLSGVQTLIFLSGLQSISTAHYEVARIEGATSYETFWRVTIPMISPMILIAAVYTLAEHFMTVQLVEYMNKIAFSNSNYGLSAAMSVMYFILSLLLISVVSWIISRRVYYND
ncbi:MAG: sugar ABC transporter permease [Eubacteriales bacterium]|nr:sugar ABC transporter permease [Eubacteriales bacterium]